MFHRVIHEHWSSIIPIISFVATAGVFFTASLRAVCLSKEKCKQLAELPLSPKEHSNE